MFAWLAEVGAAGLNEPHTPTKALVWQPAGVLSTNVLTLDVFGRASTLFEVTMQPGDNFRVAALLDTEGAAEHLNLLQVQNEPLPYYVAADNKPVSDFVGSVSSLLTVWRKLHLEFDSMTAPPASGPEALHESVTVFSVSPNYPVAGHSGMGLTVNKVVDGLNLYEGGKLEIPGVASYRILKSTARAHINGQKSSIGIEIDTVAPTNLVGLAAKLFDDDDRFLANDPPLYPSLLNLPNPVPISTTHLAQIVPLLRSAYSPAYIDVVDANAAGWNGTPTIAFRRNQTPLELNFLGQQVSYFDQGNLNLKGTDRADFWAFSVVYGYQPGHSEDGDGFDEAALEGGTPKRRLIDGTPNQSLGYSVLFMESIRDVIFRDFSPSLFADPNPVIQSKLLLEYWARISGQTAHEIGHAPGRQSESGDHAEAGLMGAGGESHKGANAPPAQKFKPRTLNRLRSIKHWTD